jgi:putative heme-binding domain-containing protein
LSEAGPVELPRFLAALAHSNDLEIGLALVKSLSSREMGLSSDLLEQTLRNFPPPVHEAARPLAERLRQAQAAQAERLTQLEASLDAQVDDSDRGRELFFGRAQCHLCHRVAGRGGAVGPDLSGIGAIRTRRDLLEAIVFPSATFARGYEPIQVRLVDGRVLTGLVGRETPGELILSAVQDNKPIEIPLRRDDIEEIQLGRVSAMPQGLEASLTAPQLADLVAFLQAQRIAEGSPRPN